MKKSGQALLSGRLAREYEFTDVGGTQPVWLYRGTGDCQLRKGSQCLANCTSDN